jgi:hypothetical protein
VAGEFACPQVLTAWERVYRLLRDAFRGSAITAAAPSAASCRRKGRALAQFADGDAAEGELLVGAGWTSFHDPPAMPGRT